MNSSSKDRKKEIFIDGPQELRGSEFLLEDYITYDE